MSGQNSEWLKQLSGNYSADDIRTGNYNTRLIIRGITLGFLSLVTAMLITTSLTNPIRLYSANAVLAFLGFVVTFLFIWEYRKDNSYSLVVLENSEKMYLIADKQERDE